MEKILDPVKREKLIAELKFCKLIKTTFRKENEIYSFTSTDAPTMMVEVGRLREIAFRAIGAGSGNSLDIDEFDTGELPYRQLIVWNPRDKEIIGGYRYAIGRKYQKTPELLSMSHYFRFSKKFIDNHLPHSIELGRAWINPLYQSATNERRSIFALDNLWEGIGAIIAENEGIKYLHGKITIPEDYNMTARILLCWFMNHYFRSANNLMFPLTSADSPKVMAISGKKIKGNDIETDFKIISSHIKSLGIVIPPLITAYLRLSQKMVSFGTTTNPELGNAFETGIMIAIKDIYPEKYERYVKTNLKSTLSYSIID
jgi:hypothetical protein